MCVMPRDRVKFTVYVCASLPHSLVVINAGLVVVGWGRGLAGWEAGGRQTLLWAVAAPSGSEDAQAVLPALSAGTGAFEK